VKEYIVTIHLFSEERGAAAKLSYIIFAEDTTDAKDKALTRIKLDYNQSIDEDVVKKRMEVREIKRKE
jgi:hypothetical protein